MAGTKNLIVEKGSTFNVLFTWSTKDINNIKTPVNLTGWTARSQMRESHDATTAVVSLTTENTGLVLGGAAGTIQLKIAPTASSAISIDKGVWDIELVDGTGNVTRLLEGSVTFKPEVTK
jgi:hypothetical protein